ncbi:hypothetical protein BY458DRAFT_264525 [Sporodiniella umbellata]|nr:hypothetical protein BY458DRAFT_264525 [Sporodiniella umbellata]
MRATFLTLALALFASANAATLNTRAVSGDVKTCINDFLASDVKVKELTTAVNAFSKSQGLNGALGLHIKVQTLQTSVKKTKDECCAVNRVVTTEDAQSMLDSVQPVVADIEASLAALTSKKADINAIPAAIGIVKTDLKNLKDLVDPLDACILAAAPDSFKTVANDLIGRINAAFDKANKSFA